MSALSIGGLGTAGCDRLGTSPTFRQWLDSAETLTRRAQRLAGREALAHEYTIADLSEHFRSNGTSMPADAAYKRHLEDGFASWRLQVDGLVDRPASYSLSDLRRLPARHQITRHDCVEGWSAIGGWTGVPLSVLLRLSGLRPDARFVVFHCADTLDTDIRKGGDQWSGRYYESIDLIDAFHPQTILAYAMNDRPLPVEHGAPLRLRVERQLGYKHAKYVMRIELASRFDHIEGGKGGFWEDRGYEWYAGI